MQAAVVVITDEQVQQTLTRIVHSLQVSTMSVQQFDTLEYLVIQNYIIQNSFRYMVLLNH